MEMETDHEKRLRSSERWELEMEMATRIDFDPYNHVAFDLSFTNLLPRSALPQPRQSYRHDGHSMFEMLYTSFIDLDSKCFVA